MDSVSQDWLATMPASHAAALGALRLHPALEVAQWGATLWLRGGILTPELRDTLRRLPSLTGWHLRKGRLCRWDRSVPEAVLPQLSWEPLAKLLRVALSNGAASGLLQQRTALGFVRSAHERPANVLLASWEDWVTWAMTAPEVRLTRLRFAVESHGRAVVWGYPLPPLQGRLFSEEDGIALPCGWACDPPLPAPALRSWLNLSAGDLALLEPDNVHHLLRADQILPATRPNIRATASL